MVAWKRFPVPEFDYEPFVDIAYEAPKRLTCDELTGLTAKLAGGDDSVCGAYAIEPTPKLMERFSFKGDNADVLGVLLPSKPVHLLGRSHAWRIQKALVLDSLDPGAAKVLHDWTTPRPMNTRLGPDDGVILAGGPCFVITGNKYADYWLGNRAVIENDWDPGKGRKGCRILAGSDPELDDFHHSYLAFDWAA